MARIRSVHPGLFTDEGFMSLSAMSRIMMIGLWVEADDQGVFEWKPLTLKARLLPADVVDMEALLFELVDAKFVARFAHDGKWYGAVRNFRRYQRPKKPNEVHPLPPEWRTYVGLSDDSPPKVTHQAGTEGGKFPQREDVGGRVEEVGVPLSEPEEGSSGGERSARSLEGPLPEFLNRREPKQFPHLWSLPEAWRQYALAEHPSLDPDDQATRFREYHIDKATLSADWEIAWHRWLRIGIDMGQHKTEEAAGPGERLTPEQTATADRHLKALTMAGLSHKAFQESEGVKLWNATSEQIQSFIRKQREAA